MRFSVFLEPRHLPSRSMRYGSPVIAALLTLVVGWALFAAQGQVPLDAMQVFFVEPLADRNGWAELLLKAAPLCLIALGLSLCFRANVWNIGAEGQMLMGGMAASGVALYFQPENRVWLLPIMIMAAMLGGMVWATIVALLRTRFNTNEILVSLMLTYVAANILIYLVSGPWRDPMGMNFPLTRQFDSDATFASLSDDWHWKFWQGTRLNTSVLMVPPLLLAVWVFQQKSLAGFKMQVGGLAPIAARYAGFSDTGAVLLGLLVSGALAGLAGVGEVAGTIGQLQSTWSPGYGFTAIIVAFVGRLHPLGVVLASLLMALLYLGGEATQTVLHLPKSISSVFQGVLLLSLLGCDLLVHYRIRLAGKVPFSKPSGV